MSPFSFLGPYRSKVVVGSVLLLVTSALALTIPWLLGQIVDALKGDHPGDVIPPLAIAMIVLAIAQSITRIGSRVSLFNAAREAEYDLRSRLFSHLMTLEAAYYRDHSTGDVMSRLTNDVQTVRVMWGPGVLNVVNTSFMFTVALILMFTIDVKLTLFALLPYPAMVGLGLAFGKKIFRASRDVQAQLGTLSSSVQEDLTGIGIIKAYGIEEERQSRFEQASTDLLHKNMVLTKIRGQLVPVLGATASLGTVVILWIGGTAVINGRIGLGELIQFNGYLALLVWPTLALGWMISLFQRGMASWKRLRELLETEPSIVDGAGPALDPDHVRGDVAIRGLTIELGGRRVIDDVSLEIPAGSVTAIVGRVGSGKSTLVEAIPRLLDIPEDTVFLDGRDIVDMRLSDLRRCVGYAPQEAFLFSTSIANNIAFGFERNGAATVSDEQLHSAARAAGLTRDLDALPSGYETLVGERGITLSGGQRQRVALARALATEPRVLILDDSLSSVDAETEQEILGHLTEVMAGRTSILISHRIAAVRRADQIAVLDEGKLVELGTHNELLDAGGVYAELYQSQIEEQPA
jgi:ATP-binding cassette subfamily B protein